MSDASTRRMLGMYMDEASAPGFLSGFFQSPAQNFHTTEKVELDVMRDDEDVAVAVQDLSTGARSNESTVYVNKGFTPTILHEKGAISSYEMIKRQAGADPFSDPEYGANATLEAFRIFRKLENKIRRTIELMASQVLQGGVVTLVDSAGTAVYSLDFLAKAAQHATVSTDWHAAGTAGDPLADLEGLCRVIRRNGKKNPTRLIFGSDAWNRFMINPAVQKRFTGDGFVGLGNLAPETRGEGASFMGKIRIGHYLMELWLYEADYKHPQTGAMTPYVAADKVIVMGDGRLDLTYGAIPRIKRPDAEAMAFLPGRMSSSSKGLDLTTNAWFTPDGSSLMVSAGTRPLTIPTAIDTFGSLDVVQ